MPSEGLRAHEPEAAWAQVLHEPLPRELGEPEPAPRHLEDGAPLPGVGGHREQVGGPDEAKGRGAAPPLAHLLRAQEAPLLPGQRRAERLGGAGGAGDEVLAHRERGGPLEPLGLGVPLQPESGAPRRRGAPLRRRGHGDGPHQRGAQGVEAELGAAGQGQVELHAARLPEDAALADQPGVGGPHGDVNLHERGVAGEPYGRHRPDRDPPEGHGGARLEAVTFTGLEDQVQAGALARERVHRRRRERGEAAAGLRLRRPGVEGDVAGAEERVEAGHRVEGEHRPHDPEARPRTGEAPCPGDEPQLHLDAEVREAHARHLADLETPVAHRVPGAEAVAVVGHQGDHRPGSLEQEPEGDQQPRDAAQGPPAGERGTARGGDHDGVGEAGAERRRGDRILIEVSHDDGGREARPPPRGRGGRTGRRQGG